MRCFMHQDTEAVAVCLCCGKAMCLDCSALDGHSGRCPSCRIDDTTKRLSELKERRRGRTQRTFVYILVTILLLAITGFAAILSFTEMFPALGIVLTWHIAIRVSVVAFVGLIGVVFLILSLLSLAKRFAANREVRKTQNQLTKYIAESNK